MKQNIKDLDQYKQEVDQSKKLIRMRRVIELTGLSKSYIYQLCKEGSFPKSLTLVPGGISVAWVESEISEWIDKRIQDRDNDLKVVEKSAPNKQA